MKNIKYLMLSFLVLGLSSSDSVRAKSQKEILSDTRQDDEAIFYDFVQAHKEIGVYAKIIASSIFASVVYGVLHNQITIQVSPGHTDTLMQQMGLGRYLSYPPIVKALMVGIKSTWWMGAFLGVPLSLAARAGSWPKLDSKDLVKPAGVGLTALSGVSLVSWGAGLFLSKDNAEATDFANGVAYIGGGLVALGIFDWMLYKRYCLNKKLKVLKENDNETHLPNQ